VSTLVICNPRSFVDDEGRAFYLADGSVTKPFMTSGKVAEMLRYVIRASVLTYELKGKPAPKRMTTFMAFKLSQDSSLHRMPAMSRLVCPDEKGDLPPQNTVYQTLMPQGYLTVKCVTLAFNEPDEAPGVGRQARARVSFGRPSATGSPRQDFTVYAIEFELVEEDGKFIYRQTGQYVV